MRYDKVKQLIKNELNETPQGLTWNELKSRLKLPYKTLCPEWTVQLEEEISLVRKKSVGRAFIWRLHKKGCRDA